MSLLLYLTVLLVSVSSVLFGLDWLAAPAPQYKPPVVVAANHASEPALPPLRHLGSDAAARLTAQPVPPPAIAKAPAAAPAPAKTVAQAQPVIAPQPDAKVNAPPPAPAVAAAEPEVAPADVAAAEGPEHPSATCALARRPIFHSAPRTARINRASAHAACARRARRRPRPQRTGRKPRPRRLGVMCKPVNKPISPSSRPTAPISLPTARAASAPNNAALRTIVTVEPAGTAPAQEQGVGLRRWHSAPYREGRFHVVPLTVVPLLFPGSRRRARRRGVRLGRDIRPRRRQAVVAAARPKRPPRQNSRPSPKWCRRNRRSNR